MSSISFPVNTSRYCFAILLTFCWFSSLFAQPANDLCVSAEEIIIIGGTGTGSGSSISATSAGAPANCGPGVDNSTGKGVWYTFTGTGMNLYEITTCNDFTNFDTEISVFSGACGALSCITGNDNDASCGTGTGSALSTVVISPMVLTQYYVYVKGDGNDCGKLNLDINDLGLVCDNDSEAPVFSNCPGNISVNNDAEDCGAKVAWTPPTLADNCPTTSSYSTDDPGDFFPVGSTTVTYSGSDGSGNQATNCSFTITINDTEAPDVNCPSNISVNNDPQDCGATINIPLPTVDDNCYRGSSTALDFDGVDDVVNLGQPNNLGTSDLTVECWFNADNIIPTNANGGTYLVGRGITAIGTPPGAGFGLRINKEAGLNEVSFIVGPGSIKAVSNSITTGTWYHVAGVRKGNEIMLYLNGNLVQTISTTSVLNLTTNLDFGIGAIIRQPFSNNTTAFDGKIDEVKLWNKALAQEEIRCNMKQGLKGNEGGLLAYYNMEDGTGSSTLSDESTSPADGTLQNMDINTDWVSGPSLVFGNLMVSNDYNNTCDASDNYPVGTTVVTYEVLDAGGLKKECSFSVTVNDGEAPNVTCPASIANVVLDGTGNGTLPANIGGGNSTDNCSATETSPALNFTCEDVGTQTVLLTATDPTGNTAGTNCNFNVVGNFNVCCTPGVVTSISGAPGPLCPQSTQTLSVSGSLNDDQSWVWYTGSCGGTQVATGVNFNVSPTATTTYYVRAEGTCSGTSGTCVSLTIFIEDTVDPEASCPADINVNNDPGLCSAVVNFTATGTDNCGGSVDISYSQDPGSAFNVGTTTINVTAKDDFGNTDNCSFDVTVTDDQAPTFINCPGNISVSNDQGQCGADVAWTPPTFSDNCPDATDNATHDPGDFFDVGTTTVIYSGSDAADNDAIDCSFTVTVNDTEVPKFSNCPGTINVFNDPGDCGALVSWTPPGFTDNCPGESFDSTHDPDDFFSVGTTTVTYTGSDDADNDAIDCSFTVSVTDNEKPNISCPANISTGTDVGECGAEVTFTPAIANDNCAVEEIKARYRSVDESNSATSSWTSRVLDPSGFFPVGRYQIQWRAEDIYGNKRSCSHYLDVYDDEDPVAVCKDVTVDFNGEEDINLTVSQVWNEAASSDNCGNVSYVGTSPGLSIDCDELGNTIALTVTIEDEAGNKDQCTSYVSVIGLPCGWAEGPQDGSLNCDGDTSSDYDPGNESFTLTADGCWHDCRESDKAAFVYHELCGDGQLTARLADINTSGYAGLMARESLDPDARRAGVLKNYSTRRVRREYRAAYGGVVSQRPSNRSRVEWLRIVRQGNSIKSYTSTNGSSWRLLYQVTFPGLEDCIYFGMTAYSLSGSKEVEAVFDNVSISSSGSLAGGFGDETTAPGQFLAYDIAGNIGEGEVNIFPNPASHETQIVLNGFEDKPVQIVIRDQFGRLVRQLDVDSAIGLSETIAVNDLAAGIYLVSIRQGQQMLVSKKLVVQP